MVLQVISYPSLHVCRGASGHVAISLPVFSLNGEHFRLVQLSGHHGSEGRLGYEPACECLNQVLFQLPSLPCTVDGGRGGGLPVTFWPCTGVTGPSLPTPRGSANPSGTHLPMCWGTEGLAVSLPVCCEIQSLFGSGGPSHLKPAGELLLQCLLQPAWVLGSQGVGALKAQPVHILCNLHPYPQHLSSPCLQGLSAIISPTVHPLFW